MEKLFFSEISLICMRIKNHSHMNSFALSLALKQRAGRVGNGLFTISGRP